MTKISNQYSLTNILTADLANSRLGINNVSPAVALDVTGAGRFSGSVTSDDLILTAGTLFSAGNTGFSNRLSDTTLYLQMPASGFNITDNALNTRFILSSAGAATFESVNAKVNTGQWHLSVQDNTSMAAGVGGGISFNGYKTGTTAQGLYAAIDGYKENSTAGNELGGFRIWTSNGTNLVERMRITSGGFLLVGQTASNPIISNTVGVRIGPESIFSNSSSEAVSIQRLNSTGAMVAFFYNPGSAYTPVGNISTNGSTITFSGSALSDVRYKENITPITNALESINKVDWVEFKFKENQKNSAGVTAQQLQTIDALSKFVINGSDEESYKAVDYNAIIGYLGKAIQELSAKVSLLENK